MEITNTEDLKIAAAQLTECISDSINVATTFARPVTNRWLPHYIRVLIWGRRRIKKCAQRTGNPADARILCVLSS